MKLFLHVLSLNVDSHFICYAQITFIGCTNTWLMCATMITMYKALQLQGKSVKIETMLVNNSAL